MFARTIDRHLERKHAARSARLSVAQVRNLNESARRTSGILEFHHRKSRKAKEDSHRPLCLDRFKRLFQLTFGFRVTNRSARCRVAHQADVEAISCSISFK